MESSNCLELVSRCALRNCLLSLVAAGVGLAATAAEPAENPIIPAGAELELVHTRQVILTAA